MSVTVFALIFLAAFAAAFVQGTAGVGFALIVAPVIGLLSPELLPVCLLLLMLPLNVYFALRERASIDRLGVRWITMGRLVGTFGGLWILLAFSTGYLNIVVGGSTVLATVLSIVFPSFDPNRRTYVAAGLVTGVTETATGIGGPPLALIYQHQEPAMLRSTIALCFLVGELISIALLAVTGHAIRPQIAHAMLFVPATVAGAWLSRLVKHRVNARALRAGVLVFSGISGCLLIMKG